MKAGIEKTKLKVKSQVTGAFGDGPPERCLGLVEDIQNTDHGIFTKYHGCNYLFKGFPDFTAVQAIAAPKRIIREAVFLLSKPPVKILAFLTGAYCLITYYFGGKKIILSFVDAILSITDISMDRMILPANKYCPIAKEFHRVFDRYQSLRMQRIRDVVCMTLEYDYTYRARAHDVLPLLDKDRFKENPKKELDHIFSIALQRERNTEVAAKWKGLQKVLKWALLIPKFKKHFVNFILELDFEKTKPDDADIYYMFDRQDYDYQGLPHSERMEISNRWDKKMNNNRLTIRFK